MKENRVMVKMCCASCIGQCSRQSAVKMYCSSFIQFIMRQAKESRGASFPRVICTEILCLVSPQASLVVCCHVCVRPVMSPSSVLLSFLSIFTLKHAHAVSARSLYVSCCRSESQLDLKSVNIGAPSCGRTRPRTTCWPPERAAVGLQSVSGLVGFFWGFNRPVPYGQTPTSYWETPRSWTGPSFTATMASANCLATTALRSCRRAALAGTTCTHAHMLYGHTHTPVGQDYILSPAASCTES